MTLLWILLAVAAWCLVPLPLAVLVGRAIAAGGHRRGRPDRRDLELAA